MPMRFRSAVRGIRFAIPGVHFMLDFQKNDDCWDCYGATRVHCPAGRRGRIAAGSDDRRGGASRCNRSTTSSSEAGASCRRSTRATTERWSIAGARTPGASSCSTATATSRRSSSAPSSRMFGAKTYCAFGSYTSTQRPGNIAAFERLLDRQVDRLASGAQDRAAHRGRAEIRQSAHRLRHRRRGAVEAHRLKLRSDLIVASRSDDRVPHLRRHPFAHHHGRDDHQQDQRHLRP